ncbi:AAA domain-containing protein [Cohnella panacarvi]|uniref:AAA domain-containing protein n=1 Tax=Cohnella panacarvi TaxID=400776 RepID=UPI00047901BF|nr:AAA domain-containing protein [Cohnella panacarvi]
MDTNTFDAAKKKLIQIYSYLQSLNQLRNPVKKSIDDQLWKLWFGDLPKYHDIECDFMEHINAADVGQKPVETYLTVRRPILTVCPEPPEVVVDWLKPGWQKFEREPELFDPTEPAEEENIDQLERFHNDEYRVEMFHEWIRERASWKQKEMPARETLKIFERLYALNATIEREQEQVELILGDGILNWTFSKSERIHHPILLQKVKLSFDPSIPEFTLSAIEEGGVFYSALFRDMEEVRANTVRACNEELEQSSCGPLDQQPTDEYLTRVASLLSANGRFFSFGEHAPNKLDLQNPIITRNPVLFLRRRSLGFAQALESILIHLEGTQSLPEAVTGITGIDLQDKPAEKNWDTPSLDVNGEDEEIYFTKEANSEQLDIAFKIRKYGSVLVQGPPGTGKTHTIANLIGHLLAEGKSILVTSHTSKALQVLRDKVVEPLQGLCVSVIQEEIGNQQMDQSIDVITERLSSINPSSLAERILRLGGLRKQLLTEIRQINQDLRTIRENEYAPIVFQGQSFNPSDAARLVHDKEELLAFIPGDILLGVGLPLNEEELGALYLSNKVIALDEEAELSSLTLPLNLLPDPNQFAEWVTEYDQLSSSPKELHQPFLNTFMAVDNEFLSELLRVTIAQVSKFSAGEVWKLVIIANGGIEDNPSSVWQELLMEIEGLMERYAEAKTAGYRYAISISEESQELQQLEETVIEMIAYLKAGRKLGKIQFLLHPKWSRTTKHIQVNGAAPADIEQLEAVLSILRHRIKQQLLLARWERQVSAVGGMPVGAFGNEPELLLPQLKIQLEQLLTWKQTMRETVQSQWEQIGFYWDRFIASKDMDLIPYAEVLHLKSMIESELPAIVESVINEWKWQSIQNQWTRLAELLVDYQTLTSPTIDGILQAIKNKDVSSYTSCYNQLSYLWGKVEVWRQRNHSLIKLEEAAPNWAKAIRNREGIHASAELFFEAHKAWLIKQLEGELDRRQGLSPVRLQQKLIDTRETFKQITVELVESKSWLAVKQKTTLKQQIALQGWKQQMKRVGKATGKLAPLRLAEARKLMPLCQTAVPVWIMPISRVMESFDPSRNQFDVVIIDEASQADVMGLTALYLGKQVIVVGDDNQVSPDAVGQKQMEVQRLIETMLMDIPNASLYDGQMSIYDLAQMSFAGKTQLREHFRCVEPIIQFSNSLSYKGSIKPLRDRSGVNRRPHTIAYRVEAVQAGNTNQVEAQVIASLLIAASEQDSYRDASFGVISLLGDEQALLIDTYLQKHMDPVEYKKRKVRCGNSAQFQGDERDVMFLSMVHTSKGDGPLSMLADPLERTKKRYNVAASRARDQMWLVYSLNESVDLKDGDLRKKLIQHMINPSAATEVLKQAEPHLQSEFEKRVMERLLHEGYHVVSQWRIGAYSIDLVVEGGGKRIAIECDGERWHPIEKLNDDIARQMILERLGWTFIRIRGSAYFRSPEATMQDVIRTLENKGVTRELHNLLEMSHGDNESLKKLIVQRAEEIRSEWEDNQDEITIGDRGSRTRKTKYANVGEEPTSFKVEPTESQQQTIDIKMDQPSAPFELLSYLKEKDLKFIDNRNKGGALWVVGDREIWSTLGPLAKQGFKFSYLPKGSQTTKNKPGWYTKNS